MVSTITETSADDTAMGCYDVLIPTDNVTILVFDGALKCRFYWKTGCTPRKFQVPLGRCWEITW